MNVLMLFWGGGEGGDAAATIELTRALQEAGVSVTLAAYCLGHRSEFQSRALKAGLKLSEDLFFIDDPEAVWAQTGLHPDTFDLIHVQHGRTIPKRTDILPLRKLAGRLPLFLTAHGPLPLTSITYGGWKSRLSRYISPMWFQAIVVPSESKRKEWKKLTVLSRKVVAIPNVVRFLHRHDSDEAKARFGIPADEDTVLFCSRLDEEKDPFTFIRAIAEAARERPGIVGIMAGSGELAWKCVALIAELKAPVKSIGYQTELDWVYSAADAFVQPSLYESFCITALQAAEMGLPCIATDIPVLREFYSELPTFKWFTPGDVPACARLIVEQVQTKEQRASQELIALRDRFSERRIVKEHIALWRKAVRK